MRLIDATRLVKLTLVERDKIPLLTTERYSFGCQTPNRHGQSMRGGIRKVLRLIEQAPTIDAVPVVHARWMRDDLGRTRCSNCHTRLPFIHCYDDEDGYEWDSEIDETLWCMHCGAKMDGDPGE